MQVGFNDQDKEAYDPYVEGLGESPERNRSHHERPENIRQIKKNEKNKIGGVDMNRFGGIKTVGRKKFAIVKVFPKDLKYGKKFGVTKKEAEDAWKEGFMKQARKKRKTKYKGLRGIEFEFY